MKFKHTFFKFSKKDFSLISVIRQVSVYPTFFPEFIISAVCVYIRALASKQTNQKKAGKTNFSRLYNYFFYEIDYFFLFNFWLNTYVPS